MKKLLIALIILSSCSASRHAVKDSIKATDESSVSSDTKIKTDDKTLTVVTETFDKDIVVPAVNVDVESKGFEIQTVNNGDTLKAKYDPTSNTIKAQYKSSPKVVKAAGTKKTEIQADVQKVEVKKIDSSRIRALEERHKEIKSSVNSTYFFIAVFVILLALVAIFFKKIKAYIKLWIG